MGESRTNWSMVVLVIVVLAMAMGFASYQTKVMIPAVAAQVGANRPLIAELNKVLTEKLGAQDKEIATLKTEVATLKSVVKDK